ncbi:glycosyltransferase [Christiangramia forsetii]|uniref:Glycosyl transferase, group 1 n=2 Tax=Christiangramia forsetii TaxID=411153 RepID=A0LYV3_CHRFK|nr:glycosyltransferase [Christiangramia forsetii]CAL65548.1 glycosyl transferase, group 1 [Christiangramia forsetii KT0803]
MKILMVSMFSIHFFRWAEQLRDTNHEVYWIDVFDSNTYVKSIDFIEQTVGWRNRWNYPGRYLLKSKAPGLNKFLNKFNQRDLKSILEEKIKEIKPEIVHSFVLQSATFSILPVMRNFPEIKWVYSAWGNDLFYRQNFDEDLKNIKETLPEIDYMFADCSRDYLLAKDFGFKGRYLGTNPTGGGYKLEEYENFISTFEERKGIIIKGYQGKLGRCNRVLEGLMSIKSELKEYRITVYGANKEVFEFAKKSGLLEWDNFEVKYNLTQTAVLKLMGNSRISVGNSISDGLPNTLLEAIIMNSFPIQSDPGGATSELIAHEKNGFLIDDPEDYKEIGDLISRAINDPAFMKKAIRHNTERIKPFLDRDYIKNQVLKQYRSIEKQLIR